MRSRELFEGNPKFRKIMDKKNNSIQNIPSNPGPSIVEIQSEVCHNTDKADKADKVSKQSETSNSFADCASAVTFDNPGPSTDIQSKICHNITDELSTDLFYKSFLEARLKTPLMSLTIEISDTADDSALSATEIPPEICSDADKVFVQPETLNLVNPINTEIIDNPETSIIEIQSDISDSAGRVSEQPTTSKFREESITRDITEIVDSSSTVGIQSEMHSNADETFGQCEMLNSSTKPASTEIIDLSSSSDSSISSETFTDDSSDDSSDNFSDDSSESSFDSHDVSIIDTVNKVTNNPMPLKSSFLELRNPNKLKMQIHHPMEHTKNPETLLHYLINNKLPNQAETVVTNSDRQTTVVNNKPQDRSKEKVEENNNNVSYAMNIFEKKRSTSPKPGCSKDIDNISSELEDSNSSFNLDELLKDAKLIHALLPKLNYHLIYRTLSNNQFARNRIELTLWDLLPVERPLPQYLQKRKRSDEVCFVQRKKNSNTSVRKNREEMNTEKHRTSKKKKQMRNEVIAGNRKLENKEFVPPTPRIYRTKDITDVRNITNIWNQNTLEMTASNNANNDTNQQKVIPTKNMFSHTMDKLNKYRYIIPDDSNINDNKIVPILKIPASPKVGSKAEEFHSTKNPEITKKYESDRSSKLLQPAKLTLQNALTTQKNEKPKSTAPLLSPAKLTVGSLLPIPDDFNLIRQNGQVIVHQFNPPTSSVNQHIPMLKSAATSSRNIYYRNRIARAFPKELNLSDSPKFNLSAIIPNTSSNNKKASDMQSNMLQQQVNLAEINLAKESKSTKIAKALNNFCTTQAPATSHCSSSTVISSNLVVNPQSPLDCEKASSSKMGTPQVYDEKAGQQHSPMLTDNEQFNWKLKVEIDETENKKFKLYACQEKSKEIENDTDKELNPKANKMYIQLMPMFSSIKPQIIRKFCSDNVKEGDERNEEALIDMLVEMLLNYNEKKLTVENTKPLESEPTTSKPVYDINEQYADLLMIFPEADPVYLRKIVEEMHNNPELMREFVQSKLEKPDYPTRAQYLTKKKITQQQKQYTTNFHVQQFLEIFPDPFSYFENDKRNCEFNPHAVDFLKHYFSKLRVNTLVKVYSQHMNNLSLTAKALEALNPDMKTRRYCNKMTLTEDIPFLQECAFIQHKVELKQYLDEVKAKEEQEFNELKAKNGLFECQCCYDDECVPSKCSTCEDGHIFCNSCIVRSTDVILGDGKTRVDCLLQCGSEFPISVLQRVLPPTKFSILLCKRQEAEVIAAGVEGLVSCPFCHFASIPPAEDKIFKCLNPECMKESCRACKELNHVPLNCNEKKAESARLYLEEKMTEALVRKCHRCGRTFFKEEGCNKMTCVCGAQMCYICDKPVTSYNHFQGQGAEGSNLCPLWSDDRRMNAEGVIKVCQETMKQIKERDPKIDINVNALLPTLPPKTKGPHENIENAMFQMFHANRIARHHFQ